MDGGNQASSPDFMAVPPRESQFEGFSAGLQNASSPANPKYNQLEEHKMLLIQSISEERALLESHILRAFNSACDALKDAGLDKIVYDDSVQTKSGDIYEFIEKIAQDSSTSYSNSKKVGWSECESDFAVPKPVPRNKASRRSKSADSSYKTVHSGNMASQFSSSRSMDVLDGFKTPRSCKRTNFNIATVTPHPRYKEAPTSILRKPKPGETAISMCGSPLRVVSDNVASPSVIVPLADGRVYEVLAKENLAAEQLPEGLDTSTIQKLKKLRDFLNTKLGTP